MEFSVKRNSILLYSGCPDCSSKDIYKLNIIGHIMPYLQCQMCGTYFSNYDGEKVIEGEVKDYIKKFAESTGIFK